MVKYDATMDWPPGLLSHLNTGGPVQTFVDSEVIRLCDPKVPFKTGALKDSALIASVIGSGMVVYATPYARKMYYGVHYNFNGAPERGAFWVERMKAEHMREIAEGAAILAGGHVE